MDYELVFMLAMVSLMVVVPVLGILNAEYRFLTKIWNYFGEYYHYRKWTKLKVGYLIRITDRWEDNRYGLITNLVFFPKKRELIITAHWDRYGSAVIYLLRQKEYSTTISPYCDEKIFEILDKVPLKVTNWRKEMEQ